MNNSNEYLARLVKQLRPNQKLEIDSAGSIKIVWKDDNGKKKSNKAGNLFLQVEEIIPLKGKLWANISTPAIKKWNKFGTKLPTRIEKDYNLTALLGIFELFEDSAKLGNHTENSYNYNTKEVKGIRVFYSHGVARFLEFKGIRINIIQGFPELKQQVFKSIEEVK